MLSHLKIELNCKDTLIIFTILACNGTNEKTSELLWHSIQTTQLSSRIKEGP